MGLPSLLIPPCGFNFWLVLFYVSAELDLSPALFFIGTVREIKFKIDLNKENSPTGEFSLFKILTEHDGIFREIGKEGAASHSH